MAFDEMTAVSNEIVPAKPVLHISVKSYGLNPDYSTEFRRVLKVLTERLGNEYHIFLIPVGKSGERNVEISSNIGYNAINLDCSKIEDLVRLVELLEGKHRED